MRSLASLFHNVDRLERELKRTGVLGGPTTLSDEEQAEADRVAAFVESNATDGEKAHLMFSTLAKAKIKLGFSIRSLYAQADPSEAGDGRVHLARNLDYDAAALTELAARIKLRQELRLPARECVVRKQPSEASHCVCLSQALDALIASGETKTKAEVLRAARQAHAERWAWLKRRPNPRPELPPRALEIGRQRAPVAPPAPTPAAVVTQTATKKFRTVRKTKRWYDVDGDGPSGIMGMKF